MSEASANYESILGLLDRIAKGPEPANRVSELRKAAVADDSGSALKAADREARPELR